MSEVTQTKAKWEQERDEAVVAWVALEERLAPLLEELVLPTSYHRGLLSKFHVRVGYSRHPHTFKDYQAAVEICKKHGYEAYGRPTSRDGRHYDETPQGTVTVIVDNQDYDICMV